jgi:hypothetical protein
MWHRWTCTVRVGVMEARRLEQGSKLQLLEENADIQELWDRH